MLEYKHCHVLNTFKDDNITGFEAIENILKLEKIVCYSNLSILLYHVTVPFKECIEWLTVCFRLLFGVVYFKTQHEVVMFHTRA